MGESEQSLSSFLNEYPVLWGVCAVVLLLPALLLISCIWPKKKVDSTAQRKKTDAPTPDDNVTGESKRERIISEKREAQAQGVRERQTSRERESSSLSGRSEPNRTVVEAEREVEIREEKDRVVQEEVAVVSNGLTIIDDQKGHSNSVQEEVAVVSNGLIIVDDQTVHSYSHTKVDAESAPTHNGGIVENGYHDNSPIVENGISEHEIIENGEEEEFEESKRRWSFPPVLDDFNLMESEADPTDLEAVFADDRLKEIELHIQPDSPGLGISIVGGSGSPSGDLPILIKRVLPKSLAEEDGRLKQGDELVAVNDTLLVGMSKDFAINALSNMHGDIRLLVLQED